MAQYIVKVPFSRVVKIGVWDNGTEKQKLGVIYERLREAYPNKEVYLINGGYFSMSNPWFAVHYTKINGKVLYAYDYAAGGIVGFREKAAPVLLPKDAIPSGYKDALTFFPVLVENRMRSPRFNVCTDASNRGRTLLGWNNNEIILAVASDVAGNADWTLDESIAVLLSAGAITGGNLDGGGSSQCNLNGKTISSSRLVYDLVYVIAEPDLSDNKKAVQYFLNTQYRFGLVLDGSLGPKSKAALVKAMQREFGIAETGVWFGTSKYKAIHRNSGNHTFARIKILQGALVRKGYWQNGSINGVWSDELESEIKRYQKNHRLSVDGSVGPVTIWSLFA